MSHKTESKDDWENHFRWNKGLILRVLLLTVILKHPVDTGHTFCPQLFQTCDVFECSQALWCHFIIFSFAKRICFLDAWMAFKGHQFNAKFGWRAFPAKHKFAAFPLNFQFSSILLIYKSAMLELLISAFHGLMAIHFLKAYDNSYSKMNREHKYKDKDEYQKISTPKKIPLEMIWNGEKLKKNLANNYFLPEMAKNWSTHFLSRMKVQSRGPFWNNLFVFFLLFNLRWAQLCVSLVV